MTLTFDEVRERFTATQAAQKSHSGNSNQAALFTATQAAQKREDKRLLWYKTPTMSTRKKSTIICVNIPTECPNQEAYLGDEISKWRIALDDFNELNNPNPQKFHSPYAKT